MKQLLLALLALLFLSAAPSEYVAQDFSRLLGMEGFSDALLKQHFTLYQGYVKNSNLLLQKLSEMDRTKQNRTPDYAGLKRMLGWEWDGMRLHELYFSNLGGKEPLKAASGLYKRIAEQFGSFDLWKESFIATGLMRGIGWVILYEDPVSKRLINSWINEHDVSHLAGGNPLLVMDVWEHAYITEYSLDRAAYIEAFFKNIDWDTVEKRVGA